MIKPLTTTDCDLRDFSFMPRRLHGDMSFNWIMQMNLDVIKKVSVADRKKQSDEKRSARRMHVYSCEWGQIRKTVFERDNFTCQYCGVRGVRIECDHVIPVSKGGLTVIENLVAACFPCNRSKGAKLLGEWLS